MAIISIGSVTIPDSPTDIQDKILEYIGWTATITQEDGRRINNPETKLQRLERYVREHFKEIYKAQKATDADSYRVQAIRDADAVIFS